MTDEMNPPADATQAPEAAPGTADVPPADIPPGAPADDEGRSFQAREWLAQLQQMIDRVAAEAGPVARDVAAKAAELAAVAGEKAGPLARRAAEVTGDVGTRVAKRSRRLADDMRHRSAEAGPAPAAEADAAPAFDGEAAPADAPAAPEEEPPA
ncbi:MAG: hypothetical protein ABIG85_04870 [Chloroflexota bacterium]